MSSRFPIGVPTRYSAGPATWEDFFTTAVRSGSWAKSFMGGVYHRRDFDDCRSVKKSRSLHSAVAGAPDSVGMTEFRGGSVQLMMLRIGICGLAPRNLPHDRQRLPQARSCSS